MKQFLHQVALASKSRILTQEASEPEMYKGWILVKHKLVY